jgi:hypothetical protein
LEKISPKQRVLDHVGWPPLDNWSTEDVTAIVYKFGRLIIWENDANCKGRILAKVRCAELREIPKSIRLIDGEHVDTESWTFSIEVLSQKLVVIPLMKILFQLKEKTHTLCQMLVS